MLHSLLRTWITFPKLPSLDSPIKFNPERIKQECFEENMVSKSPNTGDKVRLRNGTLPDLEVREWVFLGKTPQSVILISFRTKGRTLKVVKEGDIDWEDYRKRNAVPPFLKNPLQA